MEYTVEGKRHYFRLVVVVYKIEFKERFTLWRRYVYTFERTTAPDIEQLRLAEFDNPDIINVTIERVVQL